MGVRDLPADQSLGPGMPRLTAMQVHVLREASDGFTMTETAARQGRSVETVKTHLDRARATLGARNVTHAVAIAIRRRLIS